MELTLRQRSFLAAYDACGAIGKAAQAAGINRRCHTTWMHRDGYRREFEDVAKRQAQWTVDEARRRANDWQESRYRKCSPNPTNLHRIKANFVGDASTPSLDGSNGR